MPIKVLFESSTVDCTNKLLMLEKSNRGYTLKAIDKSKPFIVKGAIADFPKIIEILKQATEIGANQAEISSVVGRIECAKAKHNNRTILRLFFRILPQFILNVLPFQCLKVYQGIDNQLLVSKTQNKESHSQILNHMSETPQNVIKKEKVKETLDADSLCAKYQITQTDILEEARVTGTDPKTAQLEMIKRAAIYIKAGLDPSSCSPSLAKREQATGYALSTLRWIEESFAGVVQAGSKTLIESEKLGLSLIISGSHIIVEEELAGKGSFKKATFASDYFGMKSPEERKRLVTLRLLEHSIKDTVEENQVEIESPAESKVEPDKESIPESIEEDDELEEWLKNLEETNDVAEDGERSSRIHKKITLIDKLKKWTNIKDKRKSVPEFIKVFEKDDDDPKFHQDIPYPKWKTSALERELSQVQDEMENKKLTTNLKKLKSKKTSLINLIQARKKDQTEMNAYEVPTIAEEFLQEIEITKMLQGPSIVELERLFDLDSGEKIMLLKAAGFKLQLKGEAKTVIHLGDLIQAIKDFNLSNAASSSLLMQILQDAFEGLERLHAMGYINRDLKPENILISSEGRGKLTDFGTVCQINDTAKCRYFGTPKYSAPELCAYADTDAWKGIDEKSDVWSAGMILMECCFNGLDASDHHAIQRIESPEGIRSSHIDKHYKPRMRDAYLQLHSKPKDPSSLEHLVWWATCLNPEDRPTMAQFRKKFQEFCKHNSLPIKVTL